MLAWNRMLEGNNGKTLGGVHLDFIVVQSPAL